MTLTKKQENELIKRLLERFEQSKYTGWMGWSIRTKQEKREFIRFWILEMEQHELQLDKDAADLLYNGFKL